MPFPLQANVEDVLAIDSKYLKGLLNPVQPWGKQIHHYSVNGVFALGGKIQRSIEKHPGTNEKIHSSALQQVVVNPIVEAALREHPEMLENHLLPLEEEMKQGWTYTHGSTPPRQDTLQAQRERKSQERALESLTHAARKAASLSKRAATLLPELIDSLEHDQEKTLDMRFQESAMDKIWEEISTD